MSACAGATKARNAAFRPATSHNESTFRSDATNWFQLGTVCGVTGHGPVRWLAQRSRRLPQRRTAISFVVAQCRARTLVAKVGQFLAPASGLGVDLAIISLHSRSDERVSLAQMMKSGP